MRAESVSRLQELLNKVKWIDDTILEVDIHMGRIFHVIEKSAVSVPSPYYVVKKEKKRLSLKEVCDIVLVGTDPNSLS
jgi:hypothetical protein